jgi:hypothetical protein
MNTSVNEWLGERMNERECDLLLEWVLVWSSDFACILVSYNPLLFADYSYHSMTWCRSVHDSKLLCHESNPTGLHCKVCNSRCLMQSRITEPWPPSFQFHTLVVSVVSGPSRYHVHNVTYRLCSSHCCIPYSTALRDYCDTYSFLNYRTDAILTLLYVHLLYVICFNI